MAFYILWIDRHFFALQKSTVYQFVLLKYSKQLLLETGVLEKLQVLGIAGSGDCRFPRLRVPETAVLATRPKDGFPASIYKACSLYIIIVYVV